MSPSGMWVLQPIQGHHTTDPLSFCCRQLWATSHSSLQMPACGNWQWNWGGGTWLLSVGDKFPGVGNHTGSDMGGRQKALPGHGIPPNCAKHCHRTWEALWPHCSMGTSPAGPLTNPSGGGAEAHAAHGQQCWLSVCLHSIEQGPVTCTPVQCGPHQCHDRWCLLHSPLWSTPPAAGA